MVNTDALQKLSPVLGLSAETCYCQLNPLDFNMMDHHLIQRLANIFCKRPECKYFRLSGPSLGALSHTTQFYRCTMKSVVDNANGWAWLCPNKTLFMKTGARQDLAPGPQFDDS